MEESALGQCWQRRVLEGWWTGAVPGGGRDAQSLLLWSLRWRSVDLLQRDKGECWSRRAWRENSGVVESCCVRPWSSDKFGRLDVEQRRTGTATVGGGGERRVVSDNAATDGGRWTMLAESSVGGLVDGCSFWWWERRAELTALSNGPVV